MPCIDRRQLLYGLGAVVLTAATSNPPPAHASSDDQDVLWSETPYSLCELTGPADLRAVGLHLGFDSIANRFIHPLRSLGITPDHPETLHFLDSWHCVKMGWMRYFLLRQDNKPAALITYQCLQERISHIRTRNYAIVVPEHPLWHPVISAVSALKRQLPVGLIYDLPQKFNSVITPDGRYEITNDDNIASAITARIDGFLGDTIPPEVFQLPHVTVAVGSTFRCPSEIQSAVAMIGELGTVKATLDLNDSHAHLPGLRHCQNLQSTLSSWVTLPDLETCGDVEFSHARNIDAPLLKATGTVRTTFATKVHTPLLKATQFPGWTGTYKPFPLTQYLTTSWAKTPFP